MTEKPARKSTSPKQAPKASTPQPKVAPPKKPKKLEIAPIAREALMNSRLPKSPLDTAGRKPPSQREIDALRKFAVSLAEEGIDADEDNVLICNRITEPPRIPLTELLYDLCKWCDAEIYYDRLMPNPPNLVRVCVASGIMLLEAEKNGRN